MIRAATNICTRANTSPEKTWTCTCWITGCARSTLQQRLPDCPPQWLRQLILPPAACASMGFSPSCQRWIPQVFFWIWILCEALNEVMGVERKQNGTPAAGDVVSLARRRDAQTHRRVAGQDGGANKRAKGFRILSTGPPAWNSKPQKLINWLWSANTC